MDKFVLVGKNLDEIEKFMLDYNQSKFRAKQLYNWIYLKSVPSFDKMTDLSLDTRELLKEKTIFCELIIKDKQVSKDGTIKFLFQLKDGNYAEAVLMRFDNRAKIKRSSRKRIFACKKILFGRSVNRRRIRRNS